MTKTHAIAETLRILRTRHYALSTTQNYTHWVGRFFAFLSRRRDLERTPRVRMEAFLSDLARGDCAAATQNQAFNALLFFYREVLGEDPGEVNALRARRPKFVRHAPARDEVRALLANVQDTPTYPYRLILSLIYGCGLRVSEPLNLRLRDLDFSTGRMVIRQAKGSKDRMVQMPPSLIEPLRRQKEASMATHARAVAMGIPAKLPHRLSAKYRKGGLQAAWWWLFPAQQPCIDPSDEAGQRRVWWHCLDSGVQKAMREAATRAGLPGALSPHHLRHAWATHAADAGASPRDIQAILGHKSLETTMQYVHPEIERVVSPLECLGI
jgi:site-specific recombinase XerD